MMETLKWLEAWYYNNCNDDWEHCYGVKIETIDNPGWRVDIDLSGTEMEGIEFLPIRIERTEEDWIHCNIKDCVFLGRGGSRNLIEILNIFKDWVTKHKDSEQK